MLLERKPQFEELSSSVSTLSLQHASLWCCCSLTVYTLSDCSTFTGLNIVGHEDAFSLAFIIQNAPCGQRFVDTQPENPILDLIPFVRLTQVFPRHSWQAMSSWSSHCAQARCRAGTCSRSLNPVKRYLGATACKGILYNCFLPHCKLKTLF